MIRKPLLAALAMTLACPVSLTALAADQDATPAPSAQVKPGTADEVISPAAAVADSSEKYSPPPGFKTKVRKGETVYCRSRAPLGTRIKSEECFSETEIKEVERAMATSSEDIQQRGRMCNKGSMCTGG